MNGIEKVNGVWCLKDERLDKIFSKPQKELRRLLQKIYGGAIDDFSVAIKLRPVFAEAYYYRNLEENPLPF